MTELQPQSKNTDGEDGKDGSVVTMDEATGHWFIDGQDTGVSYKGEKGDKGDQGEQGPAGPQGPAGDRVLPGASRSCWS